MNRVIKSFVNRAVRYGPVKWQDRWERLDEYRSFEHARVARQQKYPQGTFPKRQYSEVLRNLKRDGFAIIRRAVDPSLLLRVREQLEEHLSKGTCLNKVSKDSVRKPGDLGPATVFLTDEEVKRGEAYIRQHANYASVSDPLVNCPAAVAPAFLEMLIDIAWDYLECFPAMVGLNLRKSFNNNLPEFDTLYFHSDPNDLKFLKFFFYLNDVDEEGGPFCYVKSSHLRKFRGWRSKYRWTEPEMVEHYGRENICLLTANVGDVIVADTTGFHRGTKIKARDRSMLTVDYLVRLEFEGKHAHFSIRRNDLETLTPKQRAAADLLRVVD